MFFEPKKRRYTMPRETLSVGALNKRGFRKVRNFRSISRNILETVHGMPVLTVER